MELNGHETKARDIYRQVAQREVPHHDPAKGKTRICFFHLLQMDGPCSKKHACDKSHSSAIQLTKEEKDACRLYLTKLNQAGYGPRSASRAPSQPVTAAEKERRKTRFVAFMLREGVLGEQIVIGATMRLTGARDSGASRRSAACLLW